MELAVALGVICAGVMLGCLLGALFLRKCYLTPESGRALVRVGMNGSRVVTDRSIFVLPVLHLVRDVSLTAVPINLNLDVVTQDRIYVSLRASVIVQPDITRLGRVAEVFPDTSASGISNRVEYLTRSVIQAAFRTVAIRYESSDLAVNRGDFSDDVTLILAEEYDRLGMTLLACSVPTINLLGEWDGVTL